MRKHFRRKHPGQDVQVLAERDTEMDRRIEELVSDYAVPLCQMADPELMAKCQQTNSATRHQQQCNGHRGAGDRKQPAVGGRNSVPSAVVEADQEDHEDSDGDCSTAALHKCSTCPYTSSSLKLVRGHMEMHKEHRVKCDYCNFQALYPSRVRKHWHRCHEKNGLPFKMVDIGGRTGNGGKSSPVQASTLESSKNGVTVVRDNREALKVMTAKNTITGKRCWFVSIRVI